ncbi:MATE family efflux transporter ['Camptotheca acuminata' phytoplasma]|uniref:MATE family efflux transporter n=1 Tax='Camptotheca acuminata' phytoplasma TaxID=3239192 RepID=UPI00351A250A
MKDFLWIIMQKTLSLENQITTNPNPEPKKELPIWIQLIIASLPICLYLLFQHLGSAIDYYIIGGKPDQKRLEGTIGYLKQIKKVLQSIAISLGGAGVVLVSREYKKNNKEKAKEYAVLVFFIASISALIIFLFFCLGNYIPFIGKKIFLKKDFWVDGGLEYYNISLITFVLITINSVFLGLERSKSKNFFVLFLNILNITARIVFSFAFKHMFGHNINMVHLAWADFFSNFIITLLAFYFMFNKKNEFRLEFSKLTFPKDVVHNILKLSGVLVIGKTTYDIGKKFINDMTTNYYGDKLLGIVTLAAVVNGILYVVSQSFEDGQTALVSQQAEISKNQKTLKIFKNVFVITLIIGIIGVILNQYFGISLLEILNPASKQFAQSEKDGFKTVLFFEQMSLFTSIWASMMMFYIMSYKKNANIVLLLNILRIITRIFLLWFFHEFCVSDDGYLSFGLSTSISNIVVLIVTTILFIQFIKQTKKIESNK